MRAYTSEWDSTISDYVYKYGTYSDIIEVVTSPNSIPSKLEKTNSTTNSISLKWTAVTGANAYRVTYKIRNSNTEKSTVVYDTKVTLKNLKKNGIYEVAVRPIRTDSTKSYLAQCSSCQSLYSVKVTPTKVTGAEVIDYDRDSDTLRVKYKELNSADGYQAEVWTAYKKKDTKITSNTSSIVYLDLTKDSLKKHNFVKVRVRAYSLTSSGQKKYGEWSSWAYASQQPKVKEMELSSKGMRVKFDKIQGADRYLIYMSTKYQTGYKKVATTKKTSYVITKFNKKKLSKRRYYVYVVAQKKVGKQYKSSMSDYVWYNFYY